MSLMDDFGGFLGRLADAARDSVMPHFRASMRVENKAGTGFDPVTLADRNAEAAMRRLINATFPEHGIIGEEFGSERSDAEYIWVLDPIDGTRSFIAGIPLWGTLIGLLRNGVPVLGMMAQPFTGERFAGDGRTAWYTGPHGSGPLQVRKCAALSEATLFTTSPSLFDDRRRRDYLRLEEKVRLARYGTDCYAYCMVSAGHADLVVESGLQPYDVVALIPIVQGAGGHMTNWEGNSAAKGGSIIASSDARLHEAALRVLSE